MSSNCNYILVNITWNSNNWINESIDKSNHRYIKEGGIAHESWNFDFDNKRNTDSRIYGYAQFSKSPDIKGDNNLLIFCSDKKIVGFYGQAEIFKEYQQNDNGDYNLSGEKSLSLVLDNKIDNIKEKGYLEDLQRIGQIGFSYLKKEETILKILDEAIKLNPNELKLKKLKEWVESSISSNENTFDIDKFIIDFIELSNKQKVGKGTVGVGDFNKVYNNKTYKSLSVNYSVGKGAASEITWISFLGYEQKTKRGIYPVINYIREENKLNFFYGVSNENESEYHWPDSKDWKIYKEFDVVSILNKTISVKDDLDKIIQEYHDLFTPKNSEKEIKLNMKKSKYPLNQILYGPPGTGKTYNTINKAIQIINPEFDLKQDRNKIKEEYDRLVDEGRIVFTTFHQSMSYEDFIEGIKPIEPEKDGDPVIYKIEYGIFRKVSIEAAFAIAKLRDTKAIEEVLDFSIAYDNFVEKMEEKLSGDQDVKLETKSAGSVLVESISQQGIIIIKHHSGTRTYTVSKSRLTKLQSAFKDKDLKEVNNIDHQFRSIIGGSNSSAYWSVLNAIRKEKPQQIENKENLTYTWEEKKAIVFSLKSQDFKINNSKPFILIIDEINRGNVSQIFGELITLIEEDKRLGKDESLEITLPYSKEKFGVPANLYIIGTMNTADRSVEALDTALRRRFSFQEMPPRYNLKELEKEIAGSKLFDILFTINKRIEKLLNKDHLIGHSFFLKVNSVESLQETFYKNIIPLLQEYFFGDYGKIGLVLGNGFIRKEVNAEDIFSDFDYDDKDSLNEKEIYEIIDYRTLSPDKGSFENAVKTMMNKKTS